MTFYDFFMEPFERLGLGILRKNLVKQARGSVLEIGAGTGLNLPYYRWDQISSLVMIDKELNRKALDKKIKDIPAGELSLREVNVMELPFEDESFDTVLFTLVFCSVGDADKGLREVKRVLKKDGKMLFIEHVRPEKEPLGKTFDLLTPFWKRIASGCHLNRETHKHFERLGFEIRLEKKIFSRIFIGGTGRIKDTYQTTE